MKCKIVIALLFATAGAFADKPTLFPKPALFSLDILNGWLQDPGLNSVEKFIEKLPVAYRRYFVLQYNSQSRHEASLEYPRMVFFGPDARVLTAVSGHPNDDNRNQIEFIEYKEDEARFEFAQLEFQDGKKPVLTIGAENFPNEENHCTRCHGTQDPRPNWEPYSLWPGTYGSMHDRIPRGSKENLGFKAFLESWETKERYKSLIGPFHLDSQLVNEDGTRDYYSAVGGVGGSSALTVLVNYLNRDRVVKNILSSAGNESYRLATTAALLGCEEKLTDFLPHNVLSNHPMTFAKVLKETDSLVHEDHDRRVEKVASLLGREVDFVTPNTDNYGLRKDEVRRAAALRYLFQNRKNGDLEVDRWSLSFYRTAYAFNDGVSGLENLIGQWLPQVFAKDDPLLSMIPLRTVPFEFSCYDDVSGGHHHEGGCDSYPVMLYNLTDKPTAACQELLKRAEKLNSAK